MTAALFALRRLHGRPPPGARGAARGPRSRRAAEPAARRRRQLRGPRRRPGPVRLPRRRLQRSAVLGVERPRVALLSVGEEPKKGTERGRRRPRRSSPAADGIDFRGNVEGRDLLGDAADVIVTDGFTGNVALKTIEGTASVAGAVGDAARSNPVAALGGLLLRPALGGLRRQMDPDTTGGAILLGLRGVAVVGHGSSGPEGIANAIRLAARAVEQRRGRAHRRAARALRRDAGRRCVIGRRADELSSRDEVMAKVREHLAAELEVDAGRDRGRDPLPGRPRRRLARPLRARDGARGLLRGQRSARRRPRGSRPSATRSTSCSGGCPPDRDGARDPQARARGPGAGAWPATARRACASCSTRCR